jgi:hypothetical protein
MKQFIRANEKSNMRCPDLAVVVSALCADFEPWARRDNKFGRSRQINPLGPCRPASGHQFNPAEPASIVKFFNEHPGGTAE